MDEPRQVWMPTVVLKFLVFLAFAFVIFEAMVGFSLGGGDLGSNRPGQILSIIRNSDVTVMIRIVGNVISLGITSS